MPAPADGAFGSGVGGAALATRGAGSAAGREGVALEASVPFPAGEASAELGTLRGVCLGLRRRSRGRSGRSGRPRGARRPQHRRRREARARGRRGRGAVAGRGRRAGTPRRAAARKAGPRHRGAPRRPASRSRPAGEPPDSRSPRCPARRGGATGSARRLDAPGGRRAGPGRRAPRPGAGGRAGTRLPSPSARRRTPPESLAPCGPRAPFPRAGRTPVVCGTRRCQPGGDRSPGAARRASRPAAPASSLRWTSRRSRSSRSRHRGRRPAPSRAPAPRPVLASGDRLVSARRRILLDLTRTVRTVAPAPLRGQPTDPPRGLRSGPVRARPWPPGAAPR